MKISFKYPSVINHVAFGRKKIEIENKEGAARDIEILTNPDLFEAWARAERIDKFMRLLIEDPVLMEIFCFSITEEDAADMKEWGHLRHIETDTSYPEKHLGLKNPMRYEKPRPEPKWWQRLLLRLAGHEAAA